MSKDIVKNYGKSIRSKLLNIAKNEDVYYQTVLTRYFQERLVYRISQTGYRQNFLRLGQLWTLTSWATISVTMENGLSRHSVRYAHVLAKKTLWYLVWITSLTRT